jgi:tetratricopeptide (TPR) repeat protein
MKKLQIILLLLSSLSVVAQSQKDIDKALEIAQKAIGLMDEGEIDESIKLLLKAEKLDSDRIDYPYELAYAHYLKKDYESAIAVAKRTLEHKNVIDRVYQLLGNIYDIQGDPDKAIETYELGMGKFPNSGKLHLEAGVVEHARENYNKAINYWEAGIKAEPNHSSNYYWLAKIFAQTDELIWSIIYSELFIDLELGSKRTEEISKLLYDNYQNSYVQLSDSIAEYQLTKKGFEIVLENKRDVKNIKKKGLPFEGTFATVYSFSALGFKNGINLETIYQARLNFVNNWFDKHHKNYPNKLLDFQKRILEEGLFEAYSYYIISRGDMDGFNAWQESHQDEFNKFSNWIQSNPIGLQPDNTYSRLDY